MMSSPRSLINESIEFPSIIKDTTQLVRTPYMGIGRLVSTVRGTYTLMRGPVKVRLIFLTLIYAYRPQSRIVDQASRGRCVCVCG